MATLHRTRHELERENAELRAQLIEAREMLRSIRHGEVDALVVSTPDGDRIYTLESADQAYRTLVEQMQEGAVTIVDDGTIHYSNGRFAEMVGLPLERVLGSALRDYIIETDRFEQLIHEARRGGARSEVNLRRVDGRHVPAYLGLSAVTVNGRESLCVVAADLSDQKLTERTAAREHYIRAILDQTSDAIVVCDQQGQISFANAAARRLMGDVPTGSLASSARQKWEKAGSQGRSIHVEDWSLAKALRGEATAGKEVRLFRRDDGHDDLLVNAGPLRDDRGTIIGAVATATEITDRKQTEEALALATEELRRSNHDLQQFAHTASHDLQEPLRAVDGFLQLLDKRYGPQLEPNARELIGHAMDGAKRMADLIRDLLAYSGVDRRGKQPERVETERLLAMALANLDASIRDAGAEITHDALPMLVVDDMQLVQLLQNLIGNALKFRKPQAPCRIHVGVEERSGHPAIFVRDNGIGIDPAHHQRIFEIFQRLHRRGDYPGTGVGLAICKRIVDRHGGRIWVESQPDQGATFYFTLPSREATDKYPHSATISASQGQ